MRDMSQEERQHWRELMSKGRKTPQDILWMNEHAIVDSVIETPCGRAESCINFVLVQTPEELEARKKECQRIAARLYYNQQRSSY